MLLQRGYRFKALPTEDQANRLCQFIGVARLVYNLGLEQRSNASMAAQVRRVTGRNPCFFQQAAELTLLRQQFDFIREVPQEVSNQALRDLDRAFANFFAGRARFPRPRRKFENDTCRFEGRKCEVKRLNRNWGSVRLPKLGWVRFRWIRDLPGFGGVKGRIINVTVSLSSDGFEFSFGCEIEAEAKHHTGPAVGVDRGVAVPVMLSTGESFSLPDSVKVLEAKHRRAQREASRKKRGSNRWKKAMDRARRIKSKQARCRSHWQHEVSASLSRRFGVIVLEDLKTANMTASAKGTIEEPGRNVAAKSGLNRAILNVGWYGLQLKLTYKAAALGGEIRLVNPAYTSQTCACCGSTDRGNRESQAGFLCLSCGHQDNADRNAASNILKAGTRPAPRLGNEPVKRKSRRAA